MTDATRPTSSFDDSSPETHADILISRLIDGQASAEDERAFENLADAQPHLWRELALRQRDSAALLAVVEQRLATAEEIDIPARPLRFDETPRAEVHVVRGPWLLASAGWAAALLLAVAWYFVADRPEQPLNGAMVRMAEHITPDEQLRSYLQAPYVLGELDPVMERLDTLPDGRIAVVALRRIQEVVFLDDSATLPVDDERYFLKDPAELRTATH